MVSKKPLIKSVYKRNSVPINSSQSDGTVSFNDSLGNISCINLTINDCSGNMCQLKQLFLLMLFAISIVNFTLTILNTQNIAVNNTLLQQVNETTVIITKDILRISFHLSEMDSWKYLISLAEYFDGIVCQLIKYLSPIFQIISTKPLCLIPVSGICMQITLCIWGTPARFRHLLGCILWSCTFYLQVKREIIEDYILSRVVCSTLILILTLHILLTSQKEVKIYNLNISDTSTTTSEIRTNKRNLFLKDTNNKLDSDIDSDKRKLHYLNNFSHNNFLQPHENIFLSTEQNNIMDKPIHFHDLNKISPKNSIQTNINVIDSYCNLLNNLKLNTNANKIVNNANPHFRQKEYGVKKIPDIFVKKSVLLSPTRLQTVSQESWVAGGYWKQYSQSELVTSQFQNNQLSFKSPTTLSRSSSQSSGFSSQSGDQNSYVETTHSFRANSVTNPKFFLPQFDDRLSVRSEPAYHSNL